MEWFNTVDTKFGHWQVSKKDAVLTRMCRDELELEFRRVNNSKNADFAAIYDTSALARSPNRACHPMGPPHGPPGAQGAPNGPQRCPKTATGSPKAGPRGPKAPQREPKGDQSRPKSVPMGSQRWPKTAKGSPGGPNYMNKLPINLPSGRYVNCLTIAASRITYF